jgi:hypothetical protein
MTGQLPARRLPPRPTSLNPILTAMLVVLGAFAPVVCWFSATTLARLLTPPPALPSRGGTLWPTS